MLAVSWYFLRNFQNQHYHVLCDIRLVLLLLFVDDTAADPENCFFSGDGTRRTWISDGQKLTKK